MKRILGNGINYKKAGVFFLGALLCISCVMTTQAGFSPTAVEQSKISIYDVHQITPPETLDGTILTEGFEDATMPPPGWQHIENNDATWRISTNNPHSGSYCAQIFCDPELLQQDEWLISPSLDFGSYAEIYLSFWWYTSYYWSVFPHDHHDLNVLVSIDDGTTWDLVWNEDTIGTFENWVWYNASLGTPVDLSAYTEESDVLVAFQYYGQNGSQLNLDDITVYGIGDTNRLNVDAGGPYEGYVAEDVEFVGSVEGGQPPYTWRWDFGDGNISDEEIPVHAYGAIGNYVVNLTVTDYLGIKGYDETNAIITDMSKVPELAIRNISGPIGISATLVNEGTEMAFEVDWVIEVTGGIFRRVNVEQSGNFSEIDVADSRYIGTSAFFGLGTISIKISAEAINAEKVTKQATAFLLGPFVLRIR